MNETKRQDSTVHCGLHRIRSAHILWRDADRGCVEMTQGKAMPQFAHGIYQPRNVERWILRSKTGEMRDKDYVTKPAHYNDKLFKLIPLYEVIPDD